MGTKSVKTETCTCNTENILLYGLFLRLMMVPLLRRRVFVLKESNLTSFTSFLVLTQQFICKYVTGKTDFFFLNLSFSSI